MNENVYEIDTKLINVVYHQIKEVSKPSNALSNRKMLSSIDL